MLLYASNEGRKIDKEFSLFDFHARTTLAFDQENKKKILSYTPLRFCSIPVTDLFRHSILHVCHKQLSIFFF